MPTSTIVRGASPPLSNAERLRVLKLSAEEADAEERTRSKGRFASPMRADAVQPVAIRWLWDRFVPLGALSLLYGEEGGGKSTLAMTLAARVTLGSLPGALDEPAGVEIVAFEDDPAAVLVPRLLAAGADLSRVWLHGPELTLPDEVDALSAALKDRGSKLVIIDPLPDALREGLKDNNNGDVKRGIGPLHVMAQRLGVAVLGITHPNKGATSAANKVMGSKAWRSVPRSVMIYGRDPDDLEGPTRLLAVSKTNYASKASVRVRIESATVEGVEGTLPRAVIGEATDYTDADVILANVGTPPGQRTESKLDAAKRLIMEMIEGAPGGEIDAGLVYVAGESAEITERTLRRARADLGVVVEGKRWKLPSALPL